MVLNSVHWFRKGLRLHDNPALQRSLSGADTVRCIYILDPWLVASSNIRINRWRFLLQCLEDLDSSLRKLKSRLFVVRGQPADVFPRLFKEWNMTQLTFEYDSEPFGKARDATVMKLAENAGIEVIVRNSHTLYEVDRIIEANDNKPPLTFKRFQTIIKQLELPKAPVNPVTLDQMEKCTRTIQENHDQMYGIPSLEELGFDTSELGPAIWQGGETEALARLSKHLEQQTSIANYEKPKLNADFLLSSPTGLSPYLRFGCLSCRTFYYTLLRFYRMVKKQGNPPLSLYRKLLWREFFYTAATNNPNFDKLEGNPICMQIPWDKNQQALTKWAHGQTGFPWIDAIMKQLRQEGWIHQLARRAVACFLTRGDLWISWEEGMKVFDEMLLDADFSVNAGSWMWLSCSAFFQKFFQFYCPVDFGRRTDPSGDYVRRYLPVLRGYPAKYIYEPWNAPIEVQKAANCIVGIHYPKPMINHREASRLNIERMKQIYPKLSHQERFCSCLPNHVKTAAIMEKGNKPEDTEIEDGCKPAKIPCLQSPEGDGRNEEEAMAPEYVPEKVKKAEKKLEENPYDLDAWSILIREAQNQPIDKARKTYERLVTQFPSSGRFWKLFIEAEIKAKNYDKVEKLFQRCLMKVLHIDLWKCYLAYVRETKGKLPSYKEKMAQAYDFALDKIGMEIMSYQIWVDYINFLKGVEAVGSYAENQRITAVRRVYQRGCVNPMINIEQLWRDYNKYEESINVHLAKKMIEDRSRDYMNARRVAKEYETVMKGLDRNAPSVPPQNSPQEAQQVDMWKKYIQWEKSNPLRTEDQTLITKRVMFAYEQCLLVLGHHPDIWYEAAQYLEQSSKLLAEKGDMNNAKLFSDEAANIYERAISTLLKKNMLLYFAYADYEESRMKYEKVHSIYNRLLAIEDIDPTLVYIQYMKFARRAEGIKSGRSIFKKAREDPRTRHHVYVSAALMEYYCSKDKAVAFKIFELGLKKYGDIPEYILAYIDYLSHLNEDNNTRVLFERVLTSGSLPPEKSGEIWARFLAFESNIGDLASILKVEKRRFAAFKEEYEGKETALLVDRYKFMDLFPCSNSELKALGYKDVSRNKLTAIIPDPIVTPSAVTVMKDEVDRKPEYPKPDTNQMIPFQPRHLAPPGLHPVPGGVFPVPPASVLLMKLLPPPTCFQGPFVQVDELIEVLRRCQLPDTVEQAIELITGGQPETIIEGNGPIENDAVMKKPLKRAANEDSDEEEEKGAVAPPMHDIYRARQQKRVR
ncbi:cleavage stimulation factor subunit 3 isoform X3 [Scyliorhinus canicula]|uniref:cleavage stimulation factor subunit 3 isoform X3 n=1 Tax=Scyliorhinus canicula TaxID=7830 RepID=UPI0018F452F3|nr:cleavage stimulation factor subunit 3 isoform X3 [Scyliorhinus canicula]